MENDLASHQPAEKVKKVSFACHHKAVKAALGLNKTSHPLLMTLKLNSNEHFTNA